MSASISDKIRICDRIREAATRCKKKLACLEDTDCICPVEDCVNDSVLFVKSDDFVPCPYQQMFGNEFICNCPVRKELYDKYRV